MNYGRLPLPLVSIVTVLSFVILLTTVFTHRVQSAIDHIVISEIQLRGVQPNDEFIELYNPTDVDVDISGWRLAKKTATESATPQTLVNSLAGTIPAKGFFLIANPAFTTIPALPDQWYSASSSSIAGNNTILLFSDAGQTLVDKVGLGTAADKETQTIANPEDSGSIERKALINSTADSMDISGTDEHKGNGWDSDNNANDFVLKITSQPQNKLSGKEPPPAPTDTPTPSIEPTLEPTVTPVPTSSPTPEPTGFPTDTPTPTITPSPTEIPEPTVVNTPTPTAITSPSPTDTPDPTNTPTPVPTDTPMETPTPTEVSTPTPTLSPTPHSTPTPTQMLIPTPRFIGTYVFPNRIITCQLEFRSVVSKYLTYFIPRLVCR